MRRVLSCIAPLLLLVLAACSQTVERTLPDGSVLHTTFSKTPGVLTPSATVATVHRCTGTQRCEHIQTGVVGGTPVINDAVRAAGSILAAVHWPETNVVVSAEGGQANATARSRIGDIDVDQEVTVNAGGPPGIPN